MEKKKSNLKIILPIIALIIIAIVVVLVIILNSKEESAVDDNLKIKNIVNDYADAMIDKDIDKMLDYIDFKGVIAWNSGFDSDNFNNSDYEDFVKEYNNVTATSSHNTRDTIKKYYTEFFNNGDSETIYLLKETTKLGKYLYSIEVEASVGGKGWGGVKRQTYIIYKDKIIAPFNINFDNSTKNDNKNNVSKDVINTPTTTPSKYDPKNIVKKYENVVSNYSNSSEILDTIDFRGTLAWIDAKGNYDEFIRIYDTISNDRIQEAKNEESKSWSYGSTPKEIIKYEEIKELGNDLYAIKAELKREGTPSFTSYYVVYKDKIIVPTTYTIVNDYLSQYF